MRGHDRPEDTGELNSDSTKVGMCTNRCKEVVHRVVEKVREEL